MKVLGVLVSFAFFSSTIANIVSQKCKYNVYVPSQAAPVSEVGRDCLCSPRSGQEVSQSIKVLTNTNPDLERVALFFYRDKTNNNMYMYTPSKEKQLLIPETSFETGDDLFKVKSDLSFRPFETSDAVLNIDMNQKSTDQTGQNIVKFEPKPWQNEDSWLETQTGGYTYPWYKTDDDDNVISKDYVKSNNTTSNENTYVIDESVIPDSNNDNSPVVVPENENDENTVTIDYTYDQSTEHSNEPLYPVLTESYENIDSDSVSVHMTNKYPYEDTLTSQQHITLPDYEDSDNNHALKKFNSWFKQQAKFTKLVSNDSQSFSIEEIEDYVVNLFQSNGYSIAYNRVFNANGESVNLRDYRLLRVIIKIKSPQDDQRLTSNVIGVMLVNMSPLTILGVVPLKRTFDELTMQGKDGHINILNSNDYGRSLNSIKEQISRMKSLRTGEKDDESTTKKPSAQKTMLSDLGNMLRNLIPFSPGPTRKDSEDVIPGFRIIGGNAATGSGTPITSRGRSASS